MTAFNTILERLHRDHFPQASFDEGETGRAMARDPFGRLSSEFQPVIDAADGSIAGHHALLRAADERGQPIAPSALFALAAEEESIDHLDRLARALHMVNYFAAANEATRLFVNIDAALVASAPVDHRECFDALLSSLDVPTNRVVVTLPVAILDDPVTFVRSSLWLNMRGYRVLATMRLADAHADLEHVFMADPHYVGFDLSDFSSSLDGTSWREHVFRLVEAIHARGIRSIAQRIETAEQAEFARDTGFALLQGRYFAPPDARILADVGQSRARTALSGSVAGGGW
ncbi:MAG: EAL domain-containing protein [Bacillota bacterium]